MITTNSIRRKAVKYEDGEFGYSMYTEYTMNGKLHRLDGPAIEPLNFDKRLIIAGQVYKEGRLYYIFLKK